MRSISRAVGGPLVGQGASNGDGAPIECYSARVCAICGKPGDQLYDALVDLLFEVPGKWGMRRCSECGIAWLDPQPIEKDIPKLYSKYFTHGMSTPKTFLGRLQAAISDCVLARLGYSIKPGGILPRLLSYGRSANRTAALDVLGLSASEVGTLLDVGCGNGQFIARMHSLGWKAAGVDPDRVAVSLGRKEGLHIYNGTIADVPANTQFDVITLNHVIEHVPQPIHLLRECRKRLRPGTGRLIITTPNIHSLGHSRFGCFWLGLDVPRHLILFSPEGLRKCVKRADLIPSSLSTETRLAHMMYSHGASAKAGGRRLGQGLNLKTGTRIAAHLFRSWEDVIIRYNKGAGEELFCVCSAASVNM
jgi:2-polyprenyl-3-methyl-5-hydroxy-6-metoxy-1,4-benzoquinol methylase